MKKILIVEDDPVLNENIKTALQGVEMEVQTVFDGLIASKLMRKENFDCIILDINLPHKNGYDICREFRTHNRSTPVLMLTAFNELDDKVQGFDSGADDYLTKPFYMKELLLRINSLVKRMDARYEHENALPTILSHGIKIDQVRKKVEREGSEIVLTPREYQILLKLVSAKGELVLKQDLITEIWGRTIDANTNTIEVYINFLRKKVDKPFGKSSIKTKIGFGYYLDNA